MNFKKDALKMLDEMSGDKKKQIEETVEVVSDKSLETDIGSILENLDQEIGSVEVVNKTQTKEIVEDFKPKFLGKLYESPNPLEYPDGTMYKNTRNGVVYIKEGESWEYLVEDGKSGAQGRAGAAGSGVGVDEVKNIVNVQTTITQQENFISTTKPLYIYNNIESRYVPQFSRSLYDVAQGSGLMCGIWGSSSDRRCSTSDTNLLLETSSTTGSVEYTDGWWRHMQSKYNSQFNLVWNGAVAGQVWEQTAVKIASDLSGVNMPHINYAFIRPGANNLTSGGTAESLKTSIRDILENQLLARNIKVIFITSHVTSGEDSTVEYDRLGDFFDSLVLEYPGLVMHANIYKQFGVGIATPASYTLDGIHLNETGTSIAVNAFENVVNKFGIFPQSMDPYDFGEVIMEIDPNKTTGLTLASAILTSGISDKNKQKRFLLSATANGGRVIQSSFNQGKTLSAGDLCRLMCDITSLSGSSTSTTYAAGVYLRTSAGVADAKRFGSYGSGADIGPLNGDWIRGMSRIFTISSSLLSGTQLAVTPGAGINSALVGRCALIRVKKANS